MEGLCNSHHDEQRYKCTVWEASVNIAMLRKIEVQEEQMITNGNELACNYVSCHVLFSCIPCLYNCGV